MTRTLPSEITAALADQVLYPFHALDLEFDAPNAQYYWTGLGPLTLDGNTYTGTGELLQLSEVRETNDLTAVGASATMSGIPSALLSLALSEPYQGRTARIKFGLMDVASSYLLTEAGAYILTEAGERIQLDPNPHAMFTLFSGAMDQMSVDEGPETSTIALSIENDLLRSSISNIRRYTSAYQRSVYPNDKAFDFVNDLQTRELSWGKKANHG